MGFEKNSKRENEVALSCGLVAIGVFNEIKFCVVLCTHKLALTAL